MSSEEQPSQVPTNSDDTGQSESDQEVQELNTVTYEEFIEAKKGRERERREKTQQIEKTIIEEHEKNGTPFSKDLPFEIVQ